MKKNVLWMLVAIIVCGMSIMTMTACSDDDDEMNGASDNQPLYDVSDIEVIESGQITATEFYQRMIQQATEGNSDEDELLSEFYQQQLAAIRERDKEVKDSLANVTGANGSDGADGKSVGYSYEWTTIRYKTVDVDGNSIECSELLVWPYNALFKPTPKSVIVGCHVTITSDADRPTNFSNLGHANDVNMLACFANPLSQKALVIIPDYQGYGATRDDSHPYCNREVTAQQVVDGAKAGIAYYEENKKKLDKNWKSVAVGYSQGGAVAAGTLRYVQEHGIDELRMAGAVCGDGPYDPIATLKSYIEDDRLYMPVAAALLLKGAVDTNPRMRELGCRYEDFCTKDYVDTGIFDWLAEKKMTTDDIQLRLIEMGADVSGQYGYQGNFYMNVWSNTKKEFLPYTKDVDKEANNFDLSTSKAKSYCTMNQCFKQEVIDFFRDGKVGDDVPADKLRALEQCLTENQLSYHWTPNEDSGFTLFHSTKDEVVPISNLNTVADAWYNQEDTSKHPYCGYWYTSDTTYLHVDTGTFFYVKYCGGWVNDILDGKWKCGRWTESGIPWIG